MVSPMYSAFPEIQNKWKEIAYKMTDIEEVTGLPDISSQSFTSLYLFIAYLLEESNVTIHDLPNVVSQYEKHIEYILAPEIAKEFNIKIPQSEKIGQLIERQVAETGSSAVYHKLREAISMNQFSPDDEKVPTFIMNEKDRQTVAKILPEVSYESSLSEQEIDKWESLMTEAVSKMDDLTADIMDIVNILWLSRDEVQESYASMIRFHSDDALRLRQIQTVGNTNAYRRKDREEVMKRLAALASIWVSTQDDDVEIVDARKIEDDDFSFSDMRRLFLVDDIKFAFDKKTKEPIGIYSCYIRPGRLLTNYLEGNGKSLGSISLKALSYNPRKQKYHKRLARYLSWQWRIRQRKSDYERPYKIGGDKGLLAVMGLEVNHRYPNRTKEAFEGILDRLQGDGVIGRWYYLSIDELLCKHRQGWLEDYWMNLQVIIIPPASIFEVFSLSNLDLLKAKNIAPSPPTTQDVQHEQIEFELKEKKKEIQVSPSIVQQIKKKRGLSINRAAKEIGMAHTTLSRYLKGEIQTPQSKSYEKLKEWLSKNDKFVD